jgi:hypothetical protein
MASGAGSTITLTQNLKATAMICKIHNKKEAWGFLCAAIDCGSPPPIFDLDTDLDSAEIPVNIHMCPRCAHLEGDTLGDVILKQWATYCSKCGSVLNHLVSVELVIQDMKIHFRGNN